jgi:hypothetical protein
MKALYIVYQEPHVYCLDCHDMAIPELLDRHPEHMKVVYRCTNDTCPNYNKKVEYEIPIRDVINEDKVVN